MYKRINNRIAPIQYFKSAEDTSQDATLGKALEYLKELQNQEDAKKPIRCKRFRCLCCKVKKEIDPFDEN